MPGDELISVYVATENYQGMFTDRNNVGEGATALVLTVLVAADLDASYV